MLVLTLVLFMETEMRMEEDDGQGLGHTISKPLTLTSPTDNGINPETSKPRSPEFFRAADSPLFRLRDLHVNAEMHGHAYAHQHVRSPVLVYAHMHAHQHAHQHAHPH